MLYPVHETVHHQADQYLTASGVTLRQWRGVPSWSHGWHLSELPLSQQYYHYSWFFEKWKKKRCHSLLSSSIRGERISIHMANVGSHWEKESVSCVGLNLTQPGTLKGKAGGGGHRNPPEYIWQLSGCLQLVVLCFEGPASLRLCRR